MDGSYKLKSFTDNKESEVSRLKYQVDLFYRREMELYKKIGLRDGMKLVECGSGPGFLISNIVRDLPHCNATAVEIDPFFVGLLNKSSAINGKKLFEVKHASIYDTGLPDNYFDFAVARLVIEHLKEPERAINEVRRILKPGGKLVLVSNDFAYHLLTYPVIEELDEMYLAYIKSRFSEGGNPLIGRQLPVLLKSGKFEKIDIEVICVHSELEGDKPFLKAENVNISKSLVKEGFLRKETLDSLIENWYEILQKADHVFFRQLFVISGEKSAGASTTNKSQEENDSTVTNVRSLNLENLDGLNSSEKESMLGLYFINKVQAISEQQSPGLDLQTKLCDIDIDSITAAELKSTVMSDFNTDISISDILQKFSIGDIINLIIDNHNSGTSAKTIGQAAESGSKWLEGEL